MLGANYLITNNLNLTDSYFLFQGGSMIKYSALAVLAFSIPAFASVSTSFFAPLDVQTIHKEELKIEKKGEAPRFAIPHQIKVAPIQWEEKGETLIWRHRVSAPNAVSLNFGFSKFKLPREAKLSIYSVDMKNFIRSFTSADNNQAQELWTPVIMSDDVMIELVVPAKKISELSFELSHVGQGFRTFAQKTNKSGDCNIDVACTESEGWEKEVNSVAVISTGGSRFCTGFMVNNTANDGTPFFMTAAHCRLTERTAPSLVTYWNYQTSKCGGDRDGKLTDFQTGATHLASYSKSDMTLLKLNSAPNPEWNVHFSGWDRSGADAMTAVAIHHPNVDEKSISFEYDPTEVTSYLGTAVPGDSTHVRVVDWDKGTTEPGSSGSPLFDQNHRVIGQLHGGGAACGNDDSDYYGRIFTSWEGGGTPATSLKSHLDSAGTGDLFVDTI